MNACKHTQWTAKMIPLSDGRPSLREFCAECGVSSNGSNLGFALPMIPDKDVLVASHKYPGQTLGEIHEKDPSYLVWLITESKASDRIKKSAARVYYMNPYIPPKPGEVYPDLRRYDPLVAGQWIRMIKNELD